MRKNEYITKGRLINIGKDLLSLGTELLGKGKQSENIFLSTKIRANKESNKVLGFLQ